jgi:UDP-N-acetyl-D-glucosamine dehydrogenase
MTHITKDQTHARAERPTRVAVIGLGYVGLPLAVAFARAGYEVVGIDLDPARVAQLNGGSSYIEDVPHDLLRQALAVDEESGIVGSFTATTDYGLLADCDAVSICVPTPLNKVGEPDLSFIIMAADALSRHVRPGMVIVLESTTYPGTTTEILQPRLEANTQGWRVGRELFLAFSPERIDPGRTDWTVETMPKVIGGVTPACLEAAMALYAPAVGPLVPVSSADAAELVKLFENTFRSVNIALANELLLMCDKLGLDAWEILEAAATKPFGFMKFTPGPGLGGHCIPIDPHYLSWKLRTLEYNARFIELASEINTEMPRYWVQKVQDVLNDRRKPVNGSQILVLGVAYKKNVGDLRESPALDILLLLQEKGAAIAYHDPYVPVVDYGALLLKSAPDLDRALAAADCIVIVTDHDRYDWRAIERAQAPIVDTRHVLASARHQIKSSNARLSKDSFPATDS